jgi:DNA-binding FrmR family transcriptional regulator
MDILRAIGAAIGALKSVEASILKSHLDACVRTAVEGTSRKDKKEKLEEIYQFFRSLQK